MQQAAECRRLACCKRLEGVVAPAAPFLHLGRAFWHMLRCQFDIQERDHTSGMTTACVAVASAAPGWRVQSRVFSTSPALRT